MKYLTLALVISYSAQIDASDKVAQADLYLGQTPPGDEAELFAPGIISDGFNNRDIAIMPDGSEIYYAVNMRKFEISTILVIYRRHRSWSKPEVAWFARDNNFKFLEPAISPDGSRFFFVKAANDGKNNNDIWVMEREDEGWSQPRKLGSTINTDASETFPSVTNDGTLYFSRVSDDPRIEHIYRSRLEDGQYLEAERLPDAVNSGKTQFNAFVAADESYLIVSVYGRDDSIGSIDYYVNFRNEDDQWSDSINLGDKINTAGAQEFSAYVTRDEKYLFFMSTRSPAENSTEKHYSYEQLNRIHNSPENGNSDVYWIDASVIESVRPNNF
jgi:hypothetical protein